MTQETGNEAATAETTFRAPSKIKPIERLRLGWGNFCLAISHIDDEQIQNIIKYVYINFIVLSNSSVTDAGLAYVARIPTLESLNIYGTDIRGSGLKHLHGHKRLTCIRMGSNHLDGVAIAHLEEPPEPIRLDYDFTSISDAQLRPLASLKKLEDLSLFGTAITDEGVRNLAGAKQLRILNIGGTRITDRALDHVRSVGQSLISLTLNDTGITDHGLKVLGEMPWLRELDLSSTKISGSDFTFLRPLKELRMLHLNSVRIQKNALKPISALQHLEILSIQKVDLSDKDLRYIAGVKSLILLDLSFSNLNDEDLEGLKGLKNLGSLHAYSTRVTKAGMASFKRALPNLYTAIGP